MNKKENIISLNFKLSAIKILQLVAFIFIAVGAPYFSNQFVTGSIVNAMLFVAVSTLGIESAFLLCLVPSLISIYTGLLPLTIAPMVPFIMMGNALLVLVFSKVKARGFWFGAILASLTKFGFIYFAGMILAGSVLSGISKNIMLMISWPQLATAIAGATIAFIFLKSSKRFSN